MSKLMIIEDRGRYRVAWDDGEGDPGLVVGQGLQGSRYPFPKPDGQDREAIEVWAANRALVAGGYEHTDWDGYAFENLTQAKKAIKVARAAVKNAETPMPDWALKAISEGWTQPKGWKP